MSPFLTDEVGPEFSPSPSQGKTYSRQCFAFAEDNDSKQNRTDLDLISYSCLIETYNTLSQFSCAESSSAARFDSLFLSN